MPTGNILLDRFEMPAPVSNNENSAEFRRPKNTVLEIRHNFSHHLPILLRADCPFRFAGVAAPETLAVSEAFEAYPAETVPLEVLPADMAPRSRLARDRRARQTPPLQRPQSRAGTWPHFSALSILSSQETKNLLATGKCFHLSMYSIGELPV